MRNKFRAIFSDHANLVVFLTIIEILALIALFDLYGDFIKANFSGVGAIVTVVCLGLLPHFIVLLLEIYEDKASQNKSKT